MTWSLAVSAGDFSLGGPGGFATVQDSAKLLQDLRHWLLEPRGTDPSNPDYGSSLDGGLLPDGSYEDTGLGNEISDETLLNLEAEIQRVLLAYQAQQQARLASETISLQGKNSFGVNELLTRIENIDITQVNTMVVVTVTIQTSSGDILTVTQPIS